MNSENHDRQESRPHNIGLAIWRLKCFYEKFVQGSTAVILLNFCAKNPPHRQAEKRWAQLADSALWKRFIRRILYYKKL